MGDLQLRLAFYILLVALAVTGTASKKGRKNQSAGRGKNNLNEDIWTFAVGTLDNREAYMDPLSGEPKGYYVDVINAVCARANKDCRLVYDQYSNCWDSVDGQQVGGFGLFNFYYDACAAWFQTYNRARTFKFTDAITKNQPTIFIVQPGNPRGFAWKDLTGRKLGFILGFASSPVCVARHADIITGAPLSVDQIVYYDGVTTLVQGVVDGEVDAGILSELDSSDVVDIIETDDSVFCAVGGVAMMLRKDNRLTDWWNPAWQQVLQSDQYQEICNNLLEEHGDLPGPDPEGLCIEL